MKAKVVVGFTDRDSFTHLKGGTVDFDEAYTTKLIERGVVRVSEDDTKTSKRKSGTDKASKKRERKII